MSDDKMLARIAALLGQAEDTDNPHEGGVHGGRATARHGDFHRPHRRAVAFGHAHGVAAVLRTIGIGTAGKFIAVARRTALPVYAVDATRAVIQPRS